MYITETTKEVFELFDRFEKLDTTNRLEVSIVLFEEWDRKLINEKNEINPETTDEDYEIFTASLLGIKSNTGHLIAGMFLTVMNNELITKQQVEDDNYLTLNLSNESKIWISKYEKLSYIEKIDILEEMIIRYDNETLFKTIKGLPKIDDNIDGYKIASIIENYKNKVIKKQTKFPYEIIN